MSIGAKRALNSGGKVFIEHVLPQREYARHICNLIENGANDDEILSFIERNYRLVLLDAEETVRLNRQNRSKISLQRLEDAGIQILTKVGSN